VSACLQSVQVLASLLVVKLIKVEAGSRALQ
jgi:hypothetical protein